MCILVKDIKVKGKPFCSHIIHRGTLKDCKKKIVLDKKDQYRLVFKEDK